jgi:phosphate starvation-inducible PhoH-like protein
VETLSLAGIEPVDLLGRNDRHLRLIESRLPGRVVVRGDQVILSGPQRDVQELKRVFAGLIEMVRRKRALSEADVHYAIDWREQDEPASALASEPPAILSAKRQPVTPKTFGQRDYLRAIANHDVVFAIGPAGTGKTYLAIAAAVAALRRREVDRIVLARPAVEAGESLGFLPGDYQEKVDPYLRPLYDALQDLLGEEALRRALENRIVEVAPLAYMRGRTLRHAFAILDEAQNATLGQVKMFLTRLGPESRAVVTGDITQIDLPQPESSGLVQVQEILSGVQGIAFAYLTDLDVVRHRLVQEIIRAFARGERNGERGERSGERATSVDGEERERGGERATTGDGEERAAEAADDPGPREA